MCVCATQVTAMYRSTIEINIIYDTYIWYMCNNDILLMLSQKCDVVKIIENVVSSVFARINL